MKYFVGIDPSINSTGICIMKYDGDKKIREDFIIIKPYNKEKSEDKQLTKKEKMANDDLSINFEYIFYDHEDCSLYDDNLFAEYWKTSNMVNLVTKIKEIVAEFTKDDRESLNILIEGISYGSKNRTKSIFDLAGLNYMVRNYFVNKDWCHFWIATPTSIKKFATGNGLAKKELMLDIFEKTHPEYLIIPKLDDLSDAWHMAQYVKKIEEKYSGLPTC